MEIFPCHLDLIKGVIITYLLQYVYDSVAKLWSTQVHPKDDDVTPPSLP
jgi:hypothetical protein